MKLKTHILSTSLLLLVTLLFTGCDTKNESSPVEVNTGILSSHGWKLQKLMVDNTDQTSLYTGMTLSFTSTTYSTTKGAPVWPTSGKWEFAGEDGTTVKRDDNVDVTIDQISDDQLILSLTWNTTTFKGGRVSSVSGKHVFTFVK